MTLLTLSFFSVASRPDLMTDETHLLARSMARPIAQLAAEVREVASGEPRPVAVRGTREMRQLARAFNTTLHDLAVLRKRHAAMERIAAWRDAISPRARSGAAPAPEGANEGARFAVT